MSLRSDAVSKLFESIAVETPTSVRERARELSGKFLEARAVLPLAPGDTAGSYEVLEVLGSGGQAVVYRARHVQIGRQVALKVPRREVGDRLLREARLAARLDHQSILRVEDIQLEGAVPYMVLELCEGGSLEDRLDAHPGGLPLEDVGPIAAAVLTALFFAHEAGIVHRDVKPANILFDRFGAVKVADFGIGTMSAADGLSVSVELSQLSLLAGTPLYVAPEQENPNLRVDGRLDGRADLFSFGKVLFQMLTGASPRTIRPPSRLRKGLDPSWDEYVFRLLEERPENRFASALEAMKALPQTRALVEVPVAPPVVAAAPRAVEPTAPRRETPAQRAAKLTAQACGILLIFATWFTAVRGFVGAERLAPAFYAGALGIAAGFAFAVARRAGRALDPSPASAFGACLGAAAALLGTAYATDCGLAASHDSALSLALYVAFPLQGIGFALAWVGWRALAPAEDEKPTRQEQALLAAALSAVTLFFLGILRYVLFEGRDPLAVAPAVASLSVVFTALAVKAFAELRALSRPDSPRVRRLEEEWPPVVAERKTAPGAIGALVCAILVLPILIPVALWQWLLNGLRHSLGSAWELQGLFVAALLVAAVLEIGAIVLALQARIAIRASKGTLGGLGLTTAALVLAGANAVVLAIALGAVLAL